MKINWNNKYTTIAIYAAIVSAVTIICIFIGINISVFLSYLGNILNVINPLIVGFIIAYLFNPMMKMFENKVYKFIEKKKPHPKLKRAFSIITTYLIYAIILSLVIALIIPQVVVSYNDLLGKMDIYIKSLGNLLDDIDGKLPFINTDELIGYINELLSDSYSLIQNITPYITGFFSVLVDQLKNAFLGIIISIYFLSSKEKLIAIVKKSMFAFLKREKGESIISFLKFTDDTFGGFIIGKLLDSLIIFILTFIVLALFKMPYYQLISVIVGVTNVIPFFGPFIGAIPGAFIILIANPTKALWFIIIIVIIQQIDGNIIGPKILGETTGLSSLGVIVAITVMSGLFGIVGMFIGVPIFALLYVFVKKFINYMAYKKGIASMEDTETINHEGGNVSDENESAE